MHTYLDSLERRTIEKNKSTT